MDSRCAKNAGAIFSLKDHLVWCPKSRRPVLVEAVADRLRALLAQTAGVLGMTIHGLDVMPDHVHPVVESDPTRCVAEIVNRLKGSTSRILRAAFPSLRASLPTLGSRSSSAGTVGQVSAATIERFLASPKGK